MASCMLHSIAVSLLSIVARAQQQPYTLSFDSLVGKQRLRLDAQSSFQRALTTHGVLQVSGIPSFASLRQQVLREAHACIAESPHAQALTFPDGTLRHTLAAASGVAFGLQGVDHGTDTETCHVFENSSSTLRELVANTADIFAKRLGGILDADERYQKLSRKSGQGYSTFEEVVHAGERLHHFHSYELPKIDSAVKGPTMDFHVDQGLFIAFVPAMMVSEESEPSSAFAGDFVIKTRQGAELDVRFDPDSLVFVLGDAVNQVLMPDLGSSALYAPSHAFRMPRELQLHRVWYGMMQLPPFDALVPGLGLTYGELRDEVIRASSSSDLASEPALALGCSRQLQARELSSQCNDTQIFCWHRCYDFTESLSPSACAAQNLGFNCTSQFDQIYISGHGDFEPRCTNSTETVTPRPQPTQPGLAECAEWDDALSDSNYAHKVAFVEGETYLLWNVKDDKLEGKMIHKGLAGWMSVGIVNPGGRHNGMNGAPIVLGRNFQGGSAPTVEEYVIDPMKSSFRHWKTPLNPSALEDTEMVVSSCFSSMSFKTATIYNQPLNVTSGNNYLLWGLTQLDYCTDDFGGYTGYHSDPVKDRNTRDRFRGFATLDFACSKDCKADEEGNEDSTNGASRTALATLVPLAITIAVAAHASLRAAVE